MNDINQSLLNMESYIEWILNCPIKLTMDLVNFMFTKTEIAIENIKKSNFKNYENDFKKLYTDLKKKMINFDLNITSKQYKLSSSKYLNQFNNFKKLSRFGINISQDAKNNYDKIFSNYYSKLVEISDEWIKWNFNDSAPKYNQFSENCLFLSNIDSETTDMLIKKCFNPILNILFQNISSASVTIIWIKNKLVKTNILNRVIGSLFKNNNLSINLKTENFIFIDNSINLEDTPIDYTISLEKINYSNYIPYFLKL